MRIPVYDQSVEPTVQAAPQASPLQTTAGDIAKIGQDAAPLASAINQANEMAQQNQALDQSSKVSQLGNLLSQKSSAAMGKNIGSGTGPQGTTPWAVKAQDLKGIGFTDGEIGALTPYLSPTGTSTYSTYSNALLRQASATASSNLDNDAAFLFKRYTGPTVDQLTNQYEKHEVAQVQATQVATNQAAMATARDTSLTNLLDVKTGQLNTSLIDQGLHMVSTASVGTSKILGEAAPTLTGQESQAPPAAGSTAPAPGDQAPPSGSPAAPPPSPSSPAAAPAPTDGPASEQFPRLAQDQSNYVKEVIKGAAATGNTDLLTQAYNKYGSFLHGDDITTMKEFVNKNLVKGNAQTLADQVQTQTKDDNGDQVPLSPSEQDAWLREQAKGNPELLAAARAEVATRNQVDTITQQESFGNILDHYTGLDGSPKQSRATIMASDEWASLTGQERLNLKGQFDAIDAHNAGTVTPAQQVAQYATYQKLCDDPKKLAALSDAQIASYMGTLGPDLTMKLMGAKQQAMGNLDSLNRTTLSDIKFNDIAGEYGLKIKGNLARTDQAALGSLRDKAMAAIRQEQLVSGKEVLPDRKEQIVRGLLTDVTTKGPSDWFSHTKPMFKALDDATPAEKAAATSLLTKAKAAITPANVWTMVQAARKQGGTH